MNQGLLRVVFMGTPDFSVPALQALHDDPRCEVTLVVSQPSRASGRGKKLQPPPIAAWAIANDVPVFQPEALKTDEAYERLASEQADMFIVAAYGQILRQRVLDLPRFGCINIHASLLPRWRGAAPIHRAIQAGDAVTGVSIMRMERGLDTGPVYRMIATMIGDNETAGQLHDRLSAMGAGELIESLGDIIDTSYKPAVQPNRGTTYAKMLHKSERRIPFERPASTVADTINGMSPWPGARFSTVEGDIGCVQATPLPDAPTPGVGVVATSDPENGLQIGCATGRVRIIEIKRPGKRAMLADEALRGWSLAVGTCVAEPPADNE